MLAERKTTSQENAARLGQALPANDVTIALRPYQERLVGEILTDLKTSEEVLLAVCPGAGKTEMALAVIERLPGLRVLVLAHGTSVLRTNFAKRLQERAPHLTHRVRVALPHERRAIKEKYDLVIVDEAHEFYGVEDGMVQQIIKKVGARKTLLLTGSPSGFIGQGLKPHAFSLQELNEEGKGQWNSDLMIELATSAYDIGEKDWNPDGEVRSSFGYGAATTNKTLDDLLATLTERLKLSGRSWSGWNRLVYKTVEAGWNKVLTSLKKTIIACPTIEMADRVGDYFRAKGIACLVSHSKVEDERNSSNIEDFKTDATVSLLVVVDRAQLGFDFDRLVNFVDMTGSKNPNRIFQMLCRVVRTPQGEKSWNKLFVKVMPSAFSSKSLRFFMSGVLRLAQRDFFSTWNGRGFMKIDVPVKRERKEREPGGGGGSTTPTEPLLEPGMMVFGDYFRGLAATCDKGYEPIAYVKLGETLGLSVRLTHEQIFVRAKMSGLTYLFSDSDKVPAAHDKALFRCVSSHEESKTVGSVINQGVGCAECVGMRPTWEGLQTRIAKHGKCELLVHGPVPKAKTVVSAKCALCGEVGSAWLMALTGGQGLRCCRYKRASDSQRSRYKPFTNSRGEIFGSLIAAKNSSGVYKSGILLCLRGDQKTAGGLTWRYLTDEEATQWRAADCPERMAFKERIPCLI